MSDIDKLLAEALDDFDDAGPAPNAAAAQSMAPIEAPLPLPALSPPAPLEVPPTVLQQGSSVAGSSPASGKAEAQVDELARALMESLDMDGARSNHDDASTQDFDDDQMEQTLRTLAMSAEKLADGCGAGDSSEEEEAMMRLLKQLGDGLTASGNGVAASDESVIDLLQKLGAGGGPTSEDTGRKPSTGSTHAAAPSRDAASTGAEQPPAVAPGSSSQEDHVEGMLDTLVGQLLSKDVMLEPMRHLHAEFPRYLAAHKDTLNPDQMSRYTQQAALVEQILRAYEETPDDTDRVATLMQQMQQCGPPPAEIAGPVADGVGCILA